MTSKQFFQRVSALRQLQKEYFKSRSSETLRQAKAVEREIDDEIARVNKLTSNSQPTASGNTKETSELILQIVSNIVSRKRELGIAPRYAVSLEIHQLIDSQLEQLVNDGRLTSYQASVNRIPAYDITPQF